MTLGTGPSALRWAGAACLTLLLMSYAWLAPGLQARTLFGWPLVLVYVFAVWGLAIALAAAMRPDA